MEALRWTLPSRTVSCFFHMHYMCFRNKFIRFDIWLKTRRLDIFSKKDDWKYCIWQLHKLYLTELDLIYQQRRRTGLKPHWIKSNSVISRRARGCGRGDADPSRHIDAWNVDFDKVGLHVRHRHMCRVNSFPIRLRTAFPNLFSPFERRFNNNYFAIGRPTLFPSLL